MSCTILEDRALLKKGLSVTPDKLPRKPEALRKKSLSRSTSLWSVPADAEAGSVGKRVYRQSTGSIEPKREGRSEKIGNGLCKGGLNRTTSLWNVPSDGNAGCARMARARSVSGLRPSKIPLLTHHLGSQTSLGQSLADLSVVDRFVEKSQPTVVDFVDEVDNAVVDRAYQSPEIGDRGDPIVSGPIYENLMDTKRRQIRVDSCVVTDSAKSRIDLVRTKSESFEGHAGFDLEKRAAELMAELDDDEDTSRKASRSDDRVNASNVVSEAGGEIKPRRAVERVGEARKNVLDAVVTLERGRSIARSQESLHSRREPEISIKEIRRNWEQQIRRCQGPDVKPEIKPKPNSSSRVNSATVNLSKKPLTLTNESAVEARKSIVNGKRAKDIEHLVNFFNCKNTEPTKESVQDGWPKIKDSPVTMIDRVVSDKKSKDKDEKSNGYSSDGNCSEDSGHISNENDVEWKEDARRELKSFQKSERFLKEIINDLDSSIERTIEVFDATPIVQRFVPDETKKRTLKSSLSTSSGASSIDSWEETTKTKSTTTVRRFDDDPKTETTVVERSALEVNEEQVTFFFMSNFFEREWITLVQSSFRISETMSVDLCTR